MKKIFLSLLFLLAGFSLKAEIRIFKGWSMSSGDCVATYEDGRLYKGWSKSSGDCIATYRDGRLYKGWSTSSGDCVATYENRRLYKGWSTSSGDCIFTFSTEWGLSRAMITWIVCYYFQ